VDPSADLSSLDITTNGDQIMLRFGELWWLHCVHSLHRRYQVTYPSTWGCLVLFPLKLSAGFSEPGKGQNLTSTPQDSNLQSFKSPIPSSDCKPPIT
jgi:hypothetical protein